MFINPVIPPACAPQDTLVRFALMATHTEEQVERGVQILKKVFQKEKYYKINSEKFARVGKKYVPLHPQIRHKTLCKRGVAQPVALLVLGPGGQVRILSPRQTKNSI